MPVPVALRTRSSRSRQLVVPVQNPPSSRSGFSSSVHPPTIPNMQKDFLRLALPLSGGLRRSYLANRSGSKLRADVFVVRATTPANNAH